MAGAPAGRRPARRVPACPGPESGQHRRRIAGSFPAFDSMSSTFRRPTCRAAHAPSRAGRGTPVRRPARCLSPFDRMTGVPPSANTAQRHLHREHTAGRTTLTAPLTSTHLNQLESPRAALPRSASRQERERHAVTAARLADTAISLGDGPRSAYRQVPCKRRLGSIFTLLPCTGL
jgi:hypothetical protein